MSTFENNFSTIVADFLNGNFVNPVSKFIAEKYEELNGKSSDEICEMIRDVLNLPTPTVTPPVRTATQGVSSIAPTLVGGGLPSLANLGTIAPAKTDSVKRKTTKKEAPPPPAWLSIDDYKKAISDGGKICGYLSNRATDPDKKNKVCAAAVEDSSNADYRQWRCKACDGKKGGIDAHIKLSTNGIDPTKAIPGFNVPSMNTESTAAPAASALPPLPAVPMPSALPPLPTLGSAMPNIPGLPSLGAMSSVSKIPSPKELKLPELPAPASPPRVPEPEVETKPAQTASAVQASPIAVPPPLPSLPVPVAKPMTPVPKLQLARHAGLKADHFTATNEDLKDHIIKVDRSGPTPTAEVIGKITGLSVGPASSEYESKLEELTSSESDNVKRYRIVYNYQRPVPVSFGIPDLSLPSIPGMPAIPGIPGL